MLADARLQGADLLQRIVDAAAMRARIELGDGSTLNRCDDVVIRHAGHDASFEAWCVNADECAVTISAFATSHDEQGGERIVAAGRFTFRRAKIDE